MESRGLVLCGGFDRIDNLLITGAETEIAVELAPDHLSVRCLIPADHVDRGHDHSYRTETALQSVMLAKCSLYGVQLPNKSEAFDGGHCSAFRLAREDRAGLYGTSVDVNHTGAALAGVAADMCSREAKRLAKEIHEQGAILDLGAFLHAIHGNAHKRHGSVRNALQANVVGAREPVKPS